MPFSEKTKSWIAIRENVLLLELAEINPIEFLLWSQECLNHNYIYLEFNISYRIFTGQESEGSNSEIAVNQEYGF